MKLRSFIITVLIALAVMAIHQRAAVAEDQPADAKDSSEEIPAEETAEIPPPRPQAEAETEMEAETEAEAETEMEAETEADAETETEAEVEAETEAEAETETEAEVEVEAEVEAEMEAETEAEAETETETEMADEIAEPQTPVKPNEPAPLLAAPDEGEPDEPIATADYWQPHYHEQVTERVFYLLGYPYYPGGLEYSSSTAVQTAPVSEPDPDAQPQPEDQDRADAETLESPAIEQIDPDQPEPDEQEPLADTAEIILALQECSDTIHRWRSINESANTSLEIVRSIELTKVTTRIYTIDAPLAIAVRRTIGQISRTNRRFDMTSRMVMQKLTERRLDKSLTARMEKQLGDLVSLLDRLSEQNDQIGMALGIGKLDRNPASADNNQKIDFSDMLPIAAINDNPRKK